VKTMEEKVTVFESLRGLEFSDIRRQLNSVSGQMGIYVLMFEDIVLYVGKADCMAKRVSSHMRRRRDVTRISCWNVAHLMEGFDYREVKAMLGVLEACVIRQLDPLENQQRPGEDVEWWYGLPPTVLGRIHAQAFS
jgi:hypothetical protein